MLLVQVGEIRGEELDAGVDSGQLLRGLRDVLGAEALLAGVLRHPLLALWRPGAGGGHRVPAIRVNSGGGGHSRPPDIERLAFPFFILILYRGRT